jgi:xanthine phosphoribosyltransferase
LTTYKTVTWDDLHRDARRLADRLLRRAAAEGPVLGLVAVTRGGMIPAAIIAREIGCRLVESVCVAMYDEEEAGEPSLLKPPVAAGDGTGWVIIDDLVDSGSTARLVRRLLPRAHFACLYAKPAGAAIADSWIEDVPQGTWVLFPWDTAPQFVPPLAKGVAS